MIEMIKRRPGLAVFLLAFALRLAWILTLENVLVWPDEQEFGAIAEHLAAGDGYVSNSYRTNPVVPVYLAAFFKLFGTGLLAPRIGQAAIGALTCVVLGRLATVLAGPTAGLIAGLMLAAYPAQIYLSGVFYVACIATGLSLLGIWLVVLTPTARRPLATALAAGVVLGLTALTRATFLAYLPLAPLAVLWAAPTQWRRLLPAAAVMFAISLTLVVPWSVRNTHRYERPMLISSGLWETLWKGNNELANGGPDDRNMAWDNYVWNDRLAEISPERRAEIEARYDVIVDDVRAAYEKSGDIFLARDEVLRPVVIGLIAEDPGRFAHLFGLKIVTLFDAFSDTEKSNGSTTSAKKLIASVTYYPVLLLALVGIAMIVREHRRFAAILLYISSFAVVYGMLTACTRFRLPIDPFLMLFAAVAADRLAPRLLGQRSWADSEALQPATNS